MKKTLLLITLFAFSLFCVSISAKETASNKTAEILKEIQQKASTINTYTARLKMTMGAKEYANEFDGHIVFQSPNKIRYHLSLVKPKKGTQITISDGITLWMYVPSEQIAYKQSLQNKEQKPLDGNLKNPFKDADMNTVTYKGTKYIKKTKVYVFTATPKKEIQKQNPTVFNLMKIYVGIKDGLLRQVDILSNKNDLAMRQSIYDVIINTKVDQKLFSFTPPPQTKVSTY